MNRCILLVLSIWLFSCTSTKVISSWTKPGTSADQFRNIIVLAVVGDENRALQQQMELQVANELKTLGYNATSFFQQNGPKALDQGDEQAALGQISKGGADAILTIVLLDTAKEHQYVPGRVNYYPVTYYHRFWGYYGTMYNRLYTPGYFTTNTRYFWETNLYHANGQELVYSVRTHSFDASSVSDLAEDYGRIIVKDMVKSGVISRRR
ncbi:MAG: hypothetical protein V4649_06155 [Bacteroidota bacterium]